MKLTELFEQVIYRDNKALLGQAIGTGCDRAGCSANDRL